MKRTFAVVAVQIVGNLDLWQHRYRTDDRRHRSITSAIRAGINTHGHDDFLIAHLDGDQLVMTSWQHEERGDENELAEMAEQCGWKVADR